MVERFGQVMMRVVAPGVAAAFIACWTGHRQPVGCIYHRILHSSLLLESATSTFSTTLGGPGIKVLLPHTQRRFLEAYHRVAGPLCSRLRRMGAYSLMPRRLADVQLAGPDSSNSLPWACHLRVSDRLIRSHLQGAFTKHEQHLANCIAPRGILVASPDGNLQPRPILPSTLYPSNWHCCAPRAPRRCPALLLGIW